MKDKKILYISQAAIIAALYIALSSLSGMLGLASSSIQVRISEALCVLPFFTPAAVPGLFIGCLFFNLLSGCIWQDVLFGSLATLIGAVLTLLLCRFAKKKKAATFLLPLPTILANTFIIPFVLTFYGLKGVYLADALFIFIGEFISAGLVGMLLLHAIMPFRDRLKF